MSKSVLLCGVGGQGTVLASRLIAAGAIAKGLDARTAETIGMAQRGGSVVSHVRVGEEVYASMIPKGKADIIIGFEPAEAVRNLSYLKKDGLVIVNRKAVKPVTATLGGMNYTGEEMISYLQEQAEQLIVVDGESICKQIGSSKVLNIVLLAFAAASGKLGITIEELKAAVKAGVKPKFYELNARAIDTVAEIYDSLNRKEDTHED